MSESRRNFFRNAAVLGAGLMTWAEGLRAQKSARSQPHSHSGAPHAKELSVGSASNGSPDLADLPFTMDGGAKCFI